MRFQGAESSWAPGCEGPSPPCPPVGKAGPQGSSAGTAVGGIKSSALASAGSGASLPRYWTWGGARRARPPCSQLGKISGRAPWTRAAVGVPGWPRRPGRGGGGQEAKRNGSSFLHPPRPCSPPAPALPRAPGMWQLREVGPSFLPFHRGEKLQSGMAQSASPKSPSWFGPSPDYGSEAHGPCRPGLKGSQD